MALFKTTNKLVHVLARLEAVERGADEALLVNTNGEAVEAAGGNLFWVSRNRVCTVPVARGALPGITRAVVLELCRELGFRTDERAIRPGALRKAKGIFITQSVAGIVPVAACDNQPIASSPLVDQLRRAYGEQLTRP
jgi:branched-chain amino acid aminotransferase